MDLFSLHLSQFLWWISGAGSLTWSYLWWRCLLIWHNLLLLSILLLILYLFGLASWLLGIYLLLITHGASSNKYTTICENSIAAWCHSIRICWCHVSRLLTIINCQFLLAFNRTGFHFAGQLVWHGSIGATIPHSAWTLRQELPDVLTARRTG